MKEIFEAISSALEAAGKLLVWVMVAIALEFSASAQSFYNGNFLNNGQDLQVYGTATNTFGGTNVYTKFNSPYGPGYSTTWTGSWTTNANGSLVPSTSQYWTNQSGVVFTNWVQTYYTNTSAIIDVPLWCDRDGTTPTDAAFSAHLFTTNALATNSFILRFAGVPAPGGLASTQPNNQWSFSLTSNGTNDVVVSTNFPSAPFQGCWGVRLMAVESATANGTTNAVLRSVRLNGFH